MSEELRDSVAHTGFFDETEIAGKHPTVCVFGGYFVPTEAVPELVRDLCQAKDAHGLGEAHPVKWNLRDTGLKAYYEGLGMGDDLVAVRQDPRALRTAFLGALADHGGRCFASVLAPFSDSLEREQAQEWAITNTLQRCTMHYRRPATGHHQIVVDWVKSSNKARDDAYRDGYWSGESYIRKLRSRGFAEALLYGKTMDSSALQLADHVCGLTREFIKWIVQDRHEGNIRDFMPILAPTYHRANGRVSQCGIVWGPNRDIDAELARAVALSE